MSQSHFAVLLGGLVLCACGGEPQPASPGAGTAAGGGGALAGAAGSSTGLSGGSGSGNSGGAAGGGAGQVGAAGSAGAAQSDWWDPAWSARRHLQLDNGSGTEALTAVPILVTLDATRISYVDAASDGHDLRFVDDQGTLLNHEIEAWAPDGESIVWVKLPALPGPGNVGFSMYWGNAQAEALPATHARAVWNDDYVGVWHFADTGKDATGQHDSGDAKATWVGGQHGKGASFNGTTEYVDLPGESKYVSAEPAVTFSGWVKHSGTQPDGKGIIIGIGTEVATGHASWTSVTHGNGNIIGEANPDETIRGEASSGDGSFPNDEWNYFTVVVDIAGKKIENYKNGAPVGQVFQGEWSASAFKDLPSNRAAIGAEEDRGPHWFQGSLDELRLEKGGRSAAWIAAQGHSVKGDWLSFGDAQTRP